jgi:hypothetical protein
MTRAYQAEANNKRAHDHAPAELSESSPIELKSDQQVQGDQHFASTVCTRSSTRTIPGSHFSGCINFRKSLLSKIQAINSWMACQAD